MAKREILNNDLVTVRVPEVAVDAVEGVVDKAINQTEQAIEIAEHALDLAENQVEKVVTITRNNPLLLAGVFVVGVGVGGYIAYKVVSKRLEKRFEEELTVEIAAARSFHQRLAKEGPYESPESAVQALVPEEVVEAVQSYQGRQVPYNHPDQIKTSDVPVEEEKVEVVKNVFTDARSRDEWDYALEVQDRLVNPDRPYVVSADEFNEGQEGYEQANLTYYEGDDTLSDEKDQPVDNTDYIVGDDNLLRFGHGSGDKNVVYIRNEKLSMDFEIVKSNGTYQREVLGIDPEPSLRHSSRRSESRRFRERDE